MKAVLLSFSRKPRSGGGLLPIFQERYPVNPCSPQTLQEPRLRTCKGTNYKKPQKTVCVCVCVCVFLRAPFLFGEHVLHLGAHHMGLSFLGDATNRFASQFPCNTNQKGAPIPNKTYPYPHLLKSLRKNKHISSSDRFP